MNQLGARKHTGISSLILPWSCPPNHFGGLCVTSCRGASWDRRRCRGASTACSSHPRGESTRNVLNTLSAATKFNGPRLGSDGPDNMGSISDKVTAVDVSEVVSIAQEPENHQYYR